MALVELTFPVRDDGNARHADEAVNPVMLTPADQPPAAESRVFVNEDPHLWPDPTQTGQQKLDHRCNVSGSVDTAVTQYTGKHRPAAEYIERQVAVVVVAGVEFSTLLINVERNVRVVAIKDQLRGL